MHSPVLFQLGKYDLTEENISILRSFLLPQAQESIAWPKPLCEMLDKLLLMLPHTWQYELKKIKLLEMAHGLVKAGSKGSLEQSIQAYNKHYQAVTLGNYHHLTSSFRPEPMRAMLKHRGLHDDQAQDIARFLQRNEDIEGFLGHFLTLISKSRKSDDGEPGNKSSNLQLRQLERLARSVAYARLNQLPLERSECINAATMLGAVKNLLRPNK